MRFFISLLKSIILWSLFSILPVTIAYIFLNPITAIGVYFGLGVFILIHAVNAEKSIIKFLNPTHLEIVGSGVFAIEDPSSHSFITKSLFSSKPTVWITRGALSLLSPEEIPGLIRGMILAGEEGGLRFETVLTAWMMVLIKKVPLGFREVLFFREKRTKKIHIRETARGVFWTSIILILELFYFTARKRRLQVPEEIIRKLEAESRRCVPRLPVALSSHSAVAPWPDAFLTLGRSCLLPSSAVHH